MAHGKPYYKLEMNKILETQKKLHDSLKVYVKVDPIEVDKLVIKRLILIRNAQANKHNIKLTHDFDSVLKFWLTEEEFQKYVIDGEVL